EHHHPNHCFDIDAVPGLAEHAAQFAKAQGLPQLVERPDIAECASRFEFNGRQWRIQKVWPTGHFEQARNNGIEAVGQLVQAAERDQGAMLGLAGVVTEGFNKLEILAWAGAGDLEEHASTLPAVHRLSNIAIKTTGVPLHGFFEKSP